MSILAPLMKALHRPIYESRIRELVRCILPALKPGDSVLDVGCGFGSLGRALLDSSSCPQRVSVRGVERVRRGGELIEVDEYSGQALPCGDQAFDVVLLADVLHHDRDPDRLIDECARVTRRLLIIKDHKIDGLLAKARISLIDWAANAPHGVPCLYRYNTPKEWAECHRRHALQIERELNSMRLYPPVVNLLFGRRLQYMAVLRPGSAAS